MRNYGKDTTGNVELKGCLMTSWRERLRLVDPSVARNVALHGLPDRIGDLSPVAVVRNGIDDTSGRVWAQVRSEIVFRDEFAPALEGLDGFSHVFVIGWMGEVSEEGRALLRLHPSGGADTPEVGVFATRTAHRPNPISISICPLESVDGAVAKVIGLDLVNGTPVLDVKPYVTFYDSFDAELPKWAE